MAIQNRRGIYSDFDPTKMVEGEFAVVQSGDPNTTTGKAVYISTATGTAERVALYDDVHQDVVATITDATDEVIQEVTAGIIEGVAEDVTKAETAATNAETSAQNAEASAEEAQEVLENKADNNGYYPDLYAGNLSSTKKQTDSVPYLMRKTGGDLSRIGEREADTLVGATVNVNQLVDTDTSSVTIQSGHKYYAKISGTESIGASTGTAIAVTGGTDMVVDLTAKFGSTIADYLYNLETATAGAGVAKLREWGFLTDEYIPYNSGTLESVEATAHKMVGFNCWNSETDNLRKAISANGDLMNNSTYATSDYIPVLPNTTYYAKNVGPSANVRSCFLYDSEKNPLSAISISGASGVSVSGNITTTDKTRYVRLVRFIDQTEFCFSLSSDRNGEYEPYSANTYDLGTDTLRGLFKLDSNNELYADGDTKTSDGTVTRKYKQVTYDGSESWGVEANDINGYRRFYIKDNTVMRLNDYRGNILNSKGYEIANGDGLAYNPTGDVLITAYNASTSAIGRNWMYICTKLTTMNINTVSELKAWLASNPVDVLLPLATPIAEQSTPFTNPQICDPDGTEEYVTSNGVPVGHETKYDYDIKGLAEELIDVPDVPSSNGTYVLKATRSASGISYEWVSHT